MKNNGKTIKLFLCFLMILIFCQNVFTNKNLLKSLENTVSFENLNEVKAIDFINMLNINKNNSTSDQYMIQEEDVLKNNCKKNFFVLIIISLLINLI